MAYLRIHCAACGGVWEVYHRDNWNNDKARQCPHCFAEIDRQTWEKDVLSAFGAVHDANAELYKDHTGYDKPLFSVDVMANPIYPNGKSNDRS
ncbi:MAG: hypothetical protein K2J73_02620 [Oscillospiraceae bacterium]|nr:hypothetical protein [Oscillospiraceae bacterium]